MFRSTSPTLTWPCLGTWSATGYPGRSCPGDAAADQATAEAVARLAEGNLSTAEQRKALGVIAGGLRSRGFTDFLRPKVAMAWIADTVVDIAPRVPLRNLETLRAHFPGLTDDEIADRLVRNAARTSAGIGAVGGGVAAIQWAAPPTLLDRAGAAGRRDGRRGRGRAQADRRAAGAVRAGRSRSATAHRALSLLQAWAGRRGVSLLVPGRGVAAVLGTAARHELRDRLVRRFGRNLTTLGPLFTGAAVAAFLNRRATLKLAEEVREDLAQSGPRPITAD